MSFQLKHLTSSSVSMPHYLPGSFWGTTDCGSKFPFYSDNSLKDQGTLRKREDSLLEPHVVSHTAVLGGELCFSREGSQGWL